jgi:hypothetical protein
MLTLCFRRGSRYQHEFHIAVQAASQPEAQQGLQSMQVGSTILHARWGSVDTMWDDYLLIT